KPYDNGYGCNDQDQNNPADRSAIHQITPFGFAGDSPGVWVTSCVFGNVGAERALTFPADSGVRGQDKNPILILNIFLVGAQPAL
ncbi:MAG: hypothetical protein MUO88_19350, partial [Desulfobacterales bacterium]|nr:hypothetical protein [Desulfobacterales bacterium]